jgi:hypothetical protein
MDYKSSHLKLKKGEGMVQLKQTARLAATLLVLVSLASGKKQEVQQHAPLPAKVLESKTIYIQNDSGWAEAADKAYSELKTWGRFQVVDVKEKADLIMVLAITTMQRQGTDSSWVSMYNSQTGAWTNGSVQTPSTATRRFTQIKLIDPVTGNTVWTDQQIWRRKRSATEQLIQSLRQRVEEQEKQSSR